MEQVQKYKDDNKEVANLILFVQSLLIQFQDIEGKMGKAINALSELSELFGNQANSYDAIASALGRMKFASGSSSAPNRKAWIMMYHGEAVKNLVTVSLLLFFSCPCILCADANSAWTFVVGKGCDGVLQNGDFSGEPGSGLLRYRRGRRNPRRSFILSHIRIIKFDYALIVNAIHY